MPTEPYIKRNPGDLVTAEDWNDLQKKIQDDIAKEVKDAVDGITTVSNAENSAKLENKTPEELAEQIVKRALAELSKVTGYRNYFKRLKLKEEKVLEHGLEACPLVDVYQLDYFAVVCSEDEQKEKMFVNFYLYHTSEKKIRFTPPAAAPVETIEIEPLGSTPYRFAFSDMLARYKVKYTDTSTLDELETEFWKAFFSAPNDEFDDDQYCHSPWFDRCCGDRRTVADLKKAGNWDDIWFKMKPRKTDNYSIEVAVNPTAAPTQIQVVHFDFNTLGLELLSDPVLPAESEAFPKAFRDPIVEKHELKVMVLLNAGAGIKPGTTETPKTQQY
jgi:hypothetical protein